MNLTSFPGLPKFNPMNLVHGEEQMTIFKPLQIDTEYTITETIIDCIDKKSGTLVVIESQIKESDSSAKAANVLSGMFIRGLKNANEGIKMGGIKICPDLERDLGGSGNIDLEKETQTSTQQALLYRLNNDRNPLHADPEEASRGGFDRPILHGLCTFGIAARMISDETLLRGKKVKNIASRFTNVVYPGDKLKVKAVREMNKINFEVYSDVKVMEGYTYLI